MMKVEELQEECELVTLEKLIPGDLIHLGGSLAVYVGVKDAHAEWICPEKESFKKWYEFTVMPIGSRKKPDKEVLIKQTYIDEKSKTWRFKCNSCVRDVESNQG